MIAIESYINILGSSIMIAIMFIVQDRVGTIINCDCNTFILKFILYFFFKGLVKSFLPHYGVTTTITN
jgi:hypothetical protein